MRTTRSAILVALVTAVALVVPSAHASVARAPMDRRLTDVAAISSRDAWAVGGDLLEHWDGTAWSVVDPSIERQHNFTGVAARSATDVWVVGRLVYAEQTLPLVMHFDGTSWTREYVSRPDGEALLNDVVLGPNGTVWLVGSWELFGPGGDRAGGLVYRYAGGTWRRLPVPARVTQLSGGSASGAAGLWAAGWRETPLTHPVALRWNGAAWRVYALPEPSNDNLVTDIVQGRGGQVWVVGSAWYDAASDMLDGVYVVRFDGTNWTVQKRTPRAALAAADIGPGGVLLTVGQTRPGYRAFVMRHDVAGWQRITVPAPARESGLLGVDTRTSADAWVVGWRDGAHAQVPLAMHWDGSSWVRTPVPIG